MEKSVSMDAFEGGYTGFTAKINFSISYQLQSVSPCHPTKMVCSGALHNRKKNHGTRKLGLNSWMLLRPRCDVRVEALEP